MNSLVESDLKGLLKQNTLKYTEHVKKFRESCIITITKFQELYTNDHNYSSDSYKESVKIKPIFLMTRLFPDKMRGGGRGNWQYVLYLLSECSYKVEYVCVMVSTKDAGPESPAMYF